MKRIDFKDGELVTSASVTIDGVEHEVKEAEYEGDTPLSAYTLNKLQDNVEEAIEEGSTKKIINSFNTTADKETNAPSIQAVEDKISEEISSVKGDILYEDNTITSINEDYNATLSKDISNYTYYEVWCSRYRNGNIWVTTGKIPTGKYAFISSAEVVNYFRDIECPSTGKTIKFKYNEGHEERCIPRRIIGYKI